jgi:adenosylmethionine-8-amino-7-oxononanoate aminotransferase
MRYEVVPSKTKEDTRLDRTRRLTLTAMNEWDEVKIHAIVEGLALLDDKRDEAFDAWMAQKIAAYCKKHGLVVRATQPDDLAIHKP